MNKAHLILSVIEIVLISAVVMGFLFEPVLVKWEEKQKQKVMTAWKNRKKRRGEGTNEKAS